MKRWSVSGWWALILAGLAVVFVAADPGPSAPSTAAADGLDARGWHHGTVAAGAARVLQPLPKDVDLPLPKDFLKELHGPTVIVYFSPICPHCQAAAPELVRLLQRLQGKAEIVGVATGSRPQSEVDAFAKQFGVPFRIVHDDADHHIAAALGVDSTPSVVLVEPEKKGAKVVDFWYPYLRGFDTLVEMRVNTLAGGDAWSAFRPGEYHGSRMCGECHVQELESWALSFHSIAWASLVRKHKEDDPACTACHVTGAASGGWDGSEESILVDVGCEACHGPGGPHDGEKTDPKAACAGCHDDQHSIAFSVDKGMPHLDHFASVGLDDQAFLEARQALDEGDVPRDLLSFAPGPTVGAAACKSCHIAEHTQWAGANLDGAGQAGAGHTKAMSLLKGDDAKNPECVRCHATPTATGPGAPTGLDGFRTDEGVGCEACHGSGKAHVDAGGGKGNIEGLGDDCPVCVIEAVCTGCHTPKWDPKWDLATKLPKGGHGIHPTNPNP